MLNELRKTVQNHFGFHWDSNFENENLFDNILHTFRIAVFPAVPNVSLLLNSEFERKSSQSSFVLSLSNKNYTSYRIYPVCNPSDDIRYPTTPDEVVAIVNEAISRDVKVKAFGARHSQTDIICTEGIPVEMTKLKSYKMNADNVTATFGSGVTVGEAGQFLLQHRRAFRSTPAFQNITLGGAIGTGAHGSTIKYNSSISAQVVSMTVVDGNGQKIVISDPDDLKLFKTHLGLLGMKFSNRNFVVSPTKHFNI